MAKKYLSIDETAEILSTTRKAVERRIARGQLPFRKWGKSILIPADELSEFLGALPGKSAAEAIAAAGQAGSWR